MKRQAPAWKKLFANHTSVKELLSKIRKEPYNSMVRKQPHEKMGKREF